MSWDEISEEELESFEHYDSGPFCMHYSDDCCDEVCVRCGHNCGNHSKESPHGCWVGGCLCDKFVDDGNQEEKRRADRVYQAGLEQDIIEKFMAGEISQPYIETKV